MKFSVIMGCLLGILALGVVSTDYSGTALAQESIKSGCPTCAEKYMHKKGMGIIPHEKTISCCNGKGAEHVHEKRSAEKLTCPMHKKVTASVEKETTEAVCPTCKEKTVLKKGIGITPLKREMVCIDC